MAHTVGGGSAKAKPLPIVLRADELVVEAKVAAFTLFAVCLRTNEYMSRRVSSLVICAWVITKPLKTKKKSTKEMHG